MKLTDQQIIDNFDKLRKNFKAYSAINISIKNKKGIIQKLTFNRMQNRLWQLLQEDLKKNIPIRWFVIKGRQQGNTVWCLSLIYWLCSMNENFTALVLNYDFEAVQNLAGKLQSFYQHSHRLLKPSVRKMNRNEIHFANSLEDYEKSGNIGLDSRIIFDTIDSKAIGRSFTYQAILLSEYCIYPDLNIDVKERMVALNQAIPEIPGTFVIKESTPKGDNYAKEDWENKDNGYRKIFISWVSDEEYRTEIDISNYLNFELSEIEDSRYGDEVRERDNIISELEFWYPELNGDKLALEQEAISRLVWRRNTIDKKLEGDKDKFRQEYPTKVEDAFASHSNSIFKGYKIQELKDIIISNNLKPIRYKYIHDDEVKEYWNKFYQSNYGHLHIYEEPIEGCTYVCGGDASQGIEGGDESALIVLKLPHLEEVAMFCDIIRPDEFAGVSNYLNLYYNKALLGIEINDKGGFTTVDRLENDYRYPNLYYTLGNSNKANTIRYGFHTNAIIRQIMINDYLSLVTNDSLIIKSKKLIDQMSTFIKHPNDKIAASNGKHDDLVMAMAIAIQMAKQAHIITPPPDTRIRRGSVYWWLEQNKRNANRRMAR